MESGKNRISFSDQHVRKFTDLNHYMNRGQDFDFCGVGKKRTTEVIMNQSEKCQSK